VVALPKLASVMLITDASFGNATPFSIQPRVDVAAPLHIMSTTRKPQATRKPTTSVTGAAQSAAGELILLNIH